MAIRPVSDNDPLPLTPRPMGAPLTAEARRLHATITDVAPPDIRGRALGFAGLAELAGGALGALVIGTLFGLGEAVAFRAEALVLLLVVPPCAVAIPRQARPAS